MMDSTRVLVDLAGEIQSAGIAKANTARRFDKQKSGATGVLKLAPIM